MRKIEYKKTSNLGRGDFYAVIADTLPAGRVEKNNVGVWCYFEHPSNVLNADLTNRDLEALKKAVTARLQGR